MNYLIVFFGAGLGGAARHGTNVLASRVLGAEFPFGTLIANLLGSFLMAVIIEVFALRSSLSNEARLFLTTGCLGGYTTFSTFALDTMLRLERGEWVVATAYVVISVLGGLVAFLIGMTAVRQLLGGAL
ncbi:MULTISPECIES: fluoride efflux transporter CrcB [unclassified Paracoccus (in: a-proteobacteria)]|uniref:fluoride efflux transporter CrcB n=1 Tax=unclassified Paracoccus (in: a-proteobacteria) TaxID=2688777 RepID=UPI0012B3B94B|nr:MULTISPECIES: fluoride efflux transporter CrcB [unclassified Paracoccus (in: a-proteobacteria)]UXU74308.1 fluoride efflux transporter CrcB [Paracoccus sp. SMMA_5]UXU80198.1 fluoride efflux transporter CrcB [Paracoccus sp. SMMA_5_TC]